MKNDYLLASIEFHLPIKPKKQVQLNGGAVDSSRGLKDLVGLFLGSSSAYFRVLGLSSAYFRVLQN